MPSKSFSSIYELRDANERFSVVLDEENLLLGGFQI